MADKVVHKPIEDLRPYARNTRVHGAKSISKLKASIAQFGFVVPILADASGTIIAGHGRWEAARANGLKTIPVVVADHLSDAEVRALRIADNKLAELSDWNEEALRLEFSDLLEFGLEGELDFDLTITGFATPEIDLVIGGAPDATASETETVEEPDPVAPTVARTGDLWLLGPHRIYCGNAMEPASYEIVLDAERARMVFTDPPFNVPVNGHVRSGNAGQHREFAMASGEMTDGEFRAFLKAFVAHAMTALPDGGIAMVCMDWRHVEELIAAGKGCGLELINLCVWNKTNGGMGSLYRSKHELVCVFRKPGAPHINNVELGRHGRNRTNVWDYAGVNSFGKGRAADLVDHPTVKPTALVADAIMDVTHRGDVVLDSFGGSGSTLLAAEKTGRKARLIELDPAYVDVAIRRWQEMTGKDAIHAASGQAFEERTRAELPETESEEAGDVDA
jgi:DNA modification methylase